MNGYVIVKQLSESPYGAKREFRRNSTFEILLRGMKTILFFPILYTISLLQTSFLVHFNFFAVIIPYITILIVLILNIFEKPDKKDGIYGAAILGFFWDIFSPDPIGFHLLFLVGLALLIKILLKNYFQPVIRLSPQRLRF